MTETSPSPDRESPPTDVTDLLIRWRRGETDAFEELLPRVYEGLRALARRHLAGERKDHTLQPTALVHETYLRLADHTRLQWRDRAHFFAISARIMRRLLVDHAREKGALKRGGDQERVELSDVAAPSKTVDLIDLDRALERLEAIDPRQAQVVEARYFGGLSLEETAEALDVSLATVKRDWSTAKVWLFVELEGERAAR